MPMGEGEMDRFHAAAGQAALMLVESLMLVLVSYKAGAGNQTPLSLTGIRLLSTIIPGLMDSHIHAIRAGLTYSVEVSWITSCTS